ncbi:serine hydrolase [Mesorhizobium sp. M0518]|uniref:serine hydrolase n=1 Tax=Mesorhizobium sp. M0518 TaxID=2956956 RepID=UPI00333961C7
MTIRHPVRISSVTKPFVAAAILRLWEIGEVELDHSIGSYITLAQANILAGGGYDVKAITVRLLLAQTAGLGCMFRTEAYAQLVPS